MTKKDRWNTRYAARPMVWSLEANDVVRAELEGLAPGRALDLACGEGRNALWLAACGWQVTAVDFSDPAIERAQRLASERGLTVDWQVADVTAVDYEGEFDLALITYLHTGPEERQRWLSVASRALVPDGLFLYLGHDVSNIEHGSGGPQDPAVLTTPESMAEALAADFTLARAEVVTRDVNRETGHGGAASRGRALDTLVRAVKRASPA